MNLIKKIFAWIISLIAEFFRKNRKTKKTTTKNNHSDVEEHFSKNKAKVIGIESMPDTTLPSYMLISDQEKQELIDKIKIMRDHLQNDNSVKEQSINKIIDILKENETDECEYDIDSIEKYLTEQDFSKLSPRKVNLLLDGYDDESIEKVSEIIEEANTTSRAIEEAVDNLDIVADYVENNEISLETRDFIEEQILDEREEIDTKGENIPLYDKDIISTIKNWDQSIIDKTRLEYDEVNYVTLTTIMLDDILADYDRILDDYQHRRYNKRYYEEELGRIKEKTEYLRGIKNNSAVYDEIERLRKELYTKSKDKYDILYNNEIFVNIDSKCNILLEKVNKKVVDVKKKDETVNEENKTVQEEYWQKVYLRFQDLSLAQKLILFHQELLLGKIDFAHIDKFIDGIYADFINGVNGPFNYERNKVKTELVNIYNDLNFIIAKRDNIPSVMVDHINFRMEDLVDAVTVKKQEVETIVNPKRLNNSEMVDSKLYAIRENYIELRNEKVFTRSGKRAA